MLLTSRLGGSSLVEDTAQGSSTIRHRSRSARAKAAIRAILADVRTERFVLPLGEWTEHRLEAVMEGFTKVGKDVVADELWGNSAHGVLTVTCGRRP